MNTLEAAAAVKKMLALGIFNCENIREPGVKISRVGPTIQKPEEAGGTPRPRGVETVMDEPLAGRTKKTYQTYHSNPATMECDYSGLSRAGEELIAFGCARR